MPLAYNRAADRLEGGDFFQEVRGRPVLQMLLSMRRANALAEAAKELTQRHDELPADPRSSPRPLSLVLAILKISDIPATHNGEPVTVSVDQLFERPELASAPPEYRDLCRMILVVPGADSLADAGVAGASQLASFTRQLFRTLGCAHVQARMTLSRGSGSCISPSQLTTSGEVIDVYYLTRSSETKRNFVEYRKNDLRRGLTLCADAAFAVSEDVTPVLGEARTAYRAASKGVETSRCTDSWPPNGAANLSATIDGLVEELATL